MRIEQDIKLDFRDVLIRPKRSTLASRQEVDLQREFTFKYSNATFSGVPVIAANMDGVGTFAMARAFKKAEHGMAVALRKHYSSEELIQFFSSPDAADTWYSLGVTPTDLNKLREVKAAVPTLNKLCVDVANGYSEAFLQIVKKLRKDYPNDTIMAGNVVTGDMVEALVLAGADIVKVGIGPGSVCTTRKMTGVGYPQLSAIIECADAAHGLGAQICADGGCQVPGDLAKAFGGGADFVMLGGMLAGHRESELDRIEDDAGNEFLRFYGMSSDTAQLKHEGKMRDYRASEGKTVKIPYRGEVTPTVQEILGGLRSACTYVGARKLKELSKRTTFVQVNRQLNDMFGN